MNNDKKKIIFIIIVIAIITIILLELIINKVMKGRLYKPDEPTTQEYIDDVESRNCVVTTLEDFSNFETIRNCIYTYYQSYVYTNANNIDETMSEGNQVDYYKNRLYGILSKDYISKNNITKDSLVCNKNIPNFDVDVLSMYKVSQYEESYEDYGMTTLYIAKVLFRNSSDKSTENNVIAILVDNLNKTYEVIPADYEDMEKYSSLKEGDKIDFTIPKSVEENEYNRFSIYSTSLEDYARYNFNVINNILLYNTDVAYEYLSESGRANYTSADQLNSFVNENRQKLSVMTYSSNVMNVTEDGILSLDCYDSSYNYKISIVFNGYSEFKYSIEKIK